MTNQGSGNSIWWHYEFYLSPDGSIAASDTPFSMQYPSYPMLPSGASFTDNLWVTLGSAPASNCFLVVRLTSEAPEVRTDDNTLALPIALSGPDLAALSLNSDGVAEPSAWIDVSWGVTNIGNQAVSSYSWSDGIYLSTNANGQDGKPLGGSPVYYANDLPLGPGDGYTQATSLRLPGVAPGDYYLAFKADTYGEVKDVCSTNNWFVRPITLSAPGTAPDLVPAGLVTNAPALMGLPLPITIIVTNQGTGYAESPWQYDVYISSVPRWDASARWVGGDSVYDSLAAGDVLNFNETINLPGDLYGLQYLIVRLDIQDEIYELNETNNVLAVQVTIVRSPPVITQQPADMFANLGEYVSLNVGVTGTTPLRYQWRKASANIAGATASVLWLPSLQRSDASAYDVIITNAVGAVTSQVATVTVNLAVPDTFDPSPDGQINTFAIQPDGKILVAGWFSMLGGQSCANLGRLNPDGTIDTTFNSGVDGWVACLAVQGDGKILVGGEFTQLSGQNCTNLGRLNPDGSIDAGFNAGADAPVNCLALQPNHKILVGGWFSSLGGEDCYLLGRLNPDGTLDNNFDSGTDGGVYTLALQPDGKILAGGEFSMLGYQHNVGLGRLNGDGTADTNFNSGADGWVQCLALQADGKVVVAGGFGILGGQSCTNLGRLNADGTFETNFAFATDAWVTCLAPQADGRVLVGGQFTMLGGGSCTNLGRLNADGSLDTGFQPLTDAYAYVQALGLEADGKVLVGGSFWMIGGQYRNNLARLTNTEPASQRLRYDGSTITWLRSGTVPEVGSVTFDYSKNGVSWTNLGVALPMAGGWQLGGMSLPGTGSLRARGQVSGGYDNGSAWFVESISVRDTTKPSITILTPKPNQAWSNSVFTAIGTASDNSGIDSVWYQLNTNGWFQASGTTNWAANATLRPGTNTLWACAVDIGGLSSVTQSVALKYVVTDRLTVVINPPGWGKTSVTNGQVLELGARYTNTATAGSGIVCSNWTGGVPPENVVLTNGAKVAFVMQSNLVLQANFVDVSNPTLTIKSPLPNKPYSNAVFTIQGTASDNVAVQQVQFNLNNGGWQAADGTTNWSKQVWLTTGANTLQTYAVDTSGNKSPTTNITFKHIVSERLVLSIAGKGTLSPNYSNAVLEICTTNTITATAAAGFSFTNWTGGVPPVNDILTNGRALRFVMQSNLMLQANFVDTNRPTLAITSPTPNQRWSNAVFTVKGTTKDNVRVTGVCCQTNEMWGAASLGAGGTNWTISVALVPGTNVVKAYAVDGAGNNSITNSVSFMYVLSDRLQVRVVGQGKLTPNYSNAVLEIGRSYSMKASGLNGHVFTNWVVSTNWVGGVTNSNATLTFIMQSNLTVGVTFVDVAKPTLTVKAPTANQQCSNAVFTIQGTAKDNAAVQQVEYNLNNAGWQLADGTTNWSKQVVLVKGTNTLLVSAADAAGNRSATNTVRFIYNQFLGLVGAYNGLFYPTNDLGPTNCGAITLTLGNKLGGAFSGKLTLQGTNLSFASSFDSDLRTPVVNVPRARKSPLSMTLQLNPVWQDPETQLMHSNVVTGTVADGTNWACDLVALRAFSGRNYASAGNYTMLIGGSDGPADGPPGDGAGAVAVSGTGILQLKGNLADKTPFTYSTTISVDGPWPMFVPLYGGWGLFMGWMACDTNLPGVVTTNFWLKPSLVSKDPINTNGFMAQPLVMLSKYSPATAGHSSVNWTNGRVVLEFGNLPQPLTNDVVVNNNLVRVLGGTISNLTFGITNKDGTFGGSFKHPVSHAVVKFSGVLVPPASGNNAYGGGWFVGPSEGGWVRFEPAQ